MTELRLFPGDWMNIEGNPYRMTDELIVAYYGGGSISKDISGIPLTEKIMSTWFAHADLHKDTGDGSMLLRQANDGWEIVLISGAYEFILVRLRFVHELQHAYEVFERKPLTRKEQNED